MTPKPSGFAIYRRLLSTVRPYWLAFVLAIFGNIIYGGVDAGLVKLLQPLLDEGFVARDPTFIRWMPFLILGIFLLRGVATFMSTFFMGWVGRKVVMNFRQSLFSHLGHLPQTYFDHHPSGELISRITYNVEQVANAATDAITVLVRETCTAIGLLVVMILISWQLTVLFLITMPLMALLMSQVSRRVRATSTAVQDSMGSVTHAVQEAVEGQQVIKCYGGHAFEQARFDAITQKNRREEMRLIMTTALSVPMIQMLGAFALIATVLLATANTEYTSAITPGAFASMIAAMTAILKPIKQLTKVNGTIQRGIAGASSIFELLDEPIEENLGQASLPQTRGHIIFDKVSFTYKHGIMPQLNQVSFEIKPGETVAIVGPSGAGKSTLLKLLPRFYDYQTGKIMLDGQSLTDYDLAELRQQMAVVTQQVSLFDDTLANNIAYATPQASQAEIEAAVHFAHLSEMVAGWPKGYETVIGENGMRLSGGQRQRIAIARAILKQAPILILDEATSALDSESERHIQDALEALMKNKTTLVIAHRLSTIERANKILVIDHGRIVESGTHQSLLAQNGVYANLYHLQYERSNHG